MKAVSTHDYRDLARRRLPRFLFEYVDGGAFDEVTLGENRSALREIALRQRVLRDVSRIDLQTELFGAKLRMPLALGPVGLAGLCARRGEAQAARAAEAAGIPFTLSTVSACSMEEVARAAPTPFWFQLYVMRDRDCMRDLLDRAAALGCSALMFTVDMPVPSSRYRDYRSGLAGAPGLAGTARRVCQALGKPSWAWNVGVRGRPHQLGNVAALLGDNTGLDDYFRWMRENFDPTVTWRDLEFIRQIWKGPLVIKGILDPEDARQAEQLGADGIIVSNHGGRQLDSALASARALPPIVDAIEGRIKVLADGGVRSGLDVLKLMALGADAVLLGRAWAFALASDGERGVQAMLKSVEAEMRVAMALTGTVSLDRIDRDLIIKA